MDKECPKSWKERVLIGWKAWYTDGSSYGSDKYEWEEIPQRHFMGVKRFYRNPDGKVFSEMFVCQDLFVLSDDVRDDIPEIPAEIKVGEWMSDEKFHPMYDKAKDEEEVIEVMI